MTSHRIYRSVEARPETTKRMNKAKETMRTPGNVPYLVDNLWEWARPEDYPSRRNSVYASPDPEGALSSGSNMGTVYKVELEPNCKVCQLKGIPDSKFHREVKSLPKLLLRLLTQRWIDSSLAEKKDAGQLWIPCLKKEEVEYLFNTVAILIPIRSEIYNSIRFWEDVTLLCNNLDGMATGEIFFKGDHYLREI